MNCRPGELAVIIRPYLYPELVGRIVTVTTRCEIYPDSWDTDPPIFVKGFVRPCSVADMSLRPIRDPGDDAISEDVRPLPAVVAL